MFWYECKKTLFRPTVLVWMILLLLSNSVLYGLWNQSQGIDGELYQKLQVLTDTQLEQADSSLAKDRILKERQGLKDYPAYLENILKSDIGTISIFSDSLMSQQEESVKSHYVGKNLSAGNHSEGTLSIERLQEYWLWLIPEILFLIYLLIQIVQKDKESNFSEYIQTLPKGSISCYVTRLGAVLLTMTVFTILTCLTMIGIGIGHWSISSLLDSNKNPGCFDNIHIILCTLFNYKKCLDGLGDWLYSFWNLSCLESGSERYSKCTELFKSDNTPGSFRCIYSCTLLVYRESNRISSLLIRCFYHCGMDHYSLRIQRFYIQPAMDQLKISFV